MAHNERIEEIRRLIRSVRAVTVCDLSARFAVSQVTIRKDLEALEKQGALLRTHGGAILAEDEMRTVPLSQRMERNLAAKEQIARRALELIGDARTVILDAGSTMQAIARGLRDRPIHVITNSLAVANELSTRSSGTLMLLGGDWRRESEAFIGPYTLRILSEINADVAFVGATGYDVEHGFTCQNSVESQVKTAILSRARHAYVAADSSKWNHVAFSIFARRGGIEALVTDSGLPAEARQRLEEAGIYVLTPSHGARYRKQSKQKETKRNVIRTQNRA